MTKGIFIPIDGQESQVEAIKTALGESGLTFTELQPSTPQIKRLPRLANGQISSVFVANGTKYTFVNPKDGIGIARYTTMAQLLIPFMNGKRSFEEIQRYWLNAANEMWAIQPGSDPLKALKSAQHLFTRKIYSFVDAMGDISKERYDLSMFICAVFIIREGEDMRRYNFAEAESKIEDWIEEGYTPEDFFGIASDLSNTFKSEFEAKKEAVRSQLELAKMFGNTPSEETEG